MSNFDVIENSKEKNTDFVNESICDKLDDGVLSAISSGTNGAGTSGNNDTTDMIGTGISPLIKECVRIAVRKLMKELKQNK